MSPKLKRAIPPFQNSRVTISLDDFLWHVRRDYVMRVPYFRNKLASNSALLDLSGLKENGFDKDDISFAISIASGSAIWKMPIA